MSVFVKLNAAREKFHALKLEKTGHNKFAGYNYFELGDFLIPALRVFKEVGLCAYVSFDKELARMTIIDTQANLSGGEPVSMILTSPMGSANLKGCHEVQNIGAVETYQRRYLWVAALEIVEHDALDAITGSDTKIAGPKGVIAAVLDDLPKDSDDNKDLNAISVELENIFEQFGPKAAARKLAEHDLSSDDMVRLWSLLTSKARAGIKAARMEIRATAKEM
jgi:hypothetical protein